MISEIESLIGRNIGFLRDRSGVTQEQFVARLQLLGCDISRSTLSKIEIGKRHLYIDEIVVIREVLQVSYDEIFRMPDNWF